MGALGRRLQAAREAVGLTQEQAADRLRAAGHKATLYSVRAHEQGRNDPPVKVLQSYAVIYGRSVASLAGEDVDDGQRQLAAEARALRLRLEETDNANAAAPPGATTGSPEPGIIALLDDAALAAGLGLTAEDRAALLELRWCGRIKTVEDALSVVGALLPKVGRPP